MFKNLYCKIAKVSLGLLFITGGLAYAQEWEDVGSATISAGASSYNNLAIDALGNYYVSYYDVSVTKGSVQKFNGTSWSYLGGSAGVTTGSATFNSLSLDNLGNVFYTNQDGYPNAGMDVRKFDGNAWTSYTKPFTATINHQASAISPSNTLFVYSNAESGSVKRYVNNTWEQFGANGFGTPSFSEMLVGTNGKVYVCGISSGVKVFENSATANSSDQWSLVGGVSVGSTFTEGVNSTADFTLGTDNTIYVIYSSAPSNNRRLNVKKFDGTNWGQVGNADFGISDNLYNVSIAITPAGKLYAVASGWAVNSGKNTVYTLDTATNTWVTFGGDFVSDGTAVYNDLQYDAANNSLVLTYSQNGVKVKRIALPSTSITCNNADPGNNPGDTGCVTFNYRGQSVVYTTVRGADGKIWLQQNLGSAQVATSQADVDSYGDLFQWGRWDDGHQLRNSLTATIPSINSPDGLNGSGSFIIGSSASERWWSTNALSDQWKAANALAVTSSNGADPCKAIGQGWKMPSQAEWTAAVNAEAISNPAGAYGSQLKLPAGGNRSFTNGTFDFVGQRGYFWSSDTSNSGGRFLYIGTSSANPSSGASRGQGASVRCIKDTSGLSTSDIRKVTVGVYPNPTNGILNVKVDSEIQNINVTNIVGQRMNVQFNNYQIHMNDLPSGVYIVELALKSGQKISKKIIKN